jgi:Protein of unknown function (DUF3592)
LKNTAHFNVKKNYFLCFEGVFSTFRLQKKSQIMLKFFFRIALFGLGLFLAYTFGQDFVSPLRHRMTGTTVEGRISGFLAGRHSPSVQREPDGVRKGKRRARRPVFVYPVGTDSLEARSSTGAMLTLFNYSLNERVTVVYNPNDPKDAYIYGFQVLLGAFLCICLALYMIKIGLTGRL